LHFTGIGLILLTTDGKKLMNPVMIAAAITCLGLVMALVLLLRKAASAGSSLPLTSEWIDELSVERYRPMLRLLDDGDLEFLRSQPGFTPAMAVKLRVQRCQVFGDYLQCLTADFNRVGTALKIVVLQSGRDRPELASAIVQQQMLFSCGLVTVHFRMFLYRWGICNVDVTSLVKVFDGLRLELQSMVPMGQPMSA
jgi:hypothetical protein